MRSVFAVATSLVLMQSAVHAGGGRCDPEPILAMTYNVRLDTSADGDNAWKFRKGFFIGQVATLRPDVLGMQEVLPNQREDISDGLAGYRLLGGGRDDGRGAGEASPLAIRTRTFRIGRHGMFWLSPTPDQPSLGWDAGYRRVVTWAHLTRIGDGTRILAVNTHWDHQGLEARRQSAEMLRRWTMANLSKGESLVVLGDFNAELSEAALSHLADGANLIDARGAAGAARFGPSFSFNDFQPLARGGKLIDHILVSPNLSVRYHGVIAATQNGRLASDHFPVVALIGLERKSAAARCRKPTSVPD